MPPCRCWVAVAMREPASAAQNFATSASRCASAPLASFQAARQVVQRSASRSIQASAQRCCTAGKEPIGTPNCTRCFT